MKGSHLSNSVRGRSQRLDMGLTIESEGGDVSMSIEPVERDERMRKERIVRLTKRTKFRTKRMMGRCILTLPAPKNRSFKGRVSTRSTSRDARRDYIVNTVALEDPYRPGELQAHKNKAAKPGLR